MTTKTVDLSKPVDLFATHPITQKPAHDMASDWAAMPFFERRKSQKNINDMLKRGALFYWRRDESGEWGRVELSNFVFVARVTGQPVNLHH